MTNNSKTGAKPDKPALVFVHGIFGSPDEFVPAVQHFREQGYGCYTPSLPAHGLNRHSQKLRQQTHTAFIEQVEHAVNEAVSHHHKVVLIGHSLGAILSLTVAARNYGSNLLAVAALCGAVTDATVINPVRLLELRAKSLLKCVRYIPDYWHRLPGPRIMPWEFPHLRKQGYALLQELQQNIQHVDVPVLLTHSPYDISIPFDQMEQLENLLRRSNSPMVQSVVLERCGHQIFPRSGERERVLSLLDSFLTGVALNQ